VLAQLIWCLDLQMGTTMLPKTMFERNQGFAVRSIVVFSLFFLHILLRVDPRIVYHAQEPIYSRGWAFFTFHWAYPGGVAEYLSAFLSQSLYSPWLGALIITGVVWLICACTRAILISAGGKHCGVISLVPVIFLVVLHNRYEYALSLDLALLVYLLGLVAFSRAASLQPLARVVVFAGLAVALYWTAGGPLLVFALVSGIIELRQRGSVWPGLACLGGGLILPYLATLCVYPGRVSDAYGRGLPFVAEYLRGDPVALASAAAIYVLLPATILVLLWRRGAIGAAAAREAQSASAASPIGAHWRWLAGTLVLTIAGAIPAFSTLDGNHRSLLKLDYHARSGEWSSVLKEARRLKAYSVLAVYDIQRALAHLGRLGDDMLSYPHLANQPIFTPSPETPRLLVALCDVLLDVGQVNKAEHMAQEALEIHGDRASILQRLVLINALKGRPDAARVYLGRLNKTLLHRDWAREYGRALDADPELRTDPRVMAIRPLMLQADYPGYFTPDALLRQSLDHNGQNFLAYEYLMAHYLQTRQLGGLIEGLERLREMPPQVQSSLLPRHYAEAVLLYLMQGRLQTGQMPEIPLYGRGIGEQTNRRFGEFSRMLASHKADQTAARTALAAKYRDTYWYYYLFKGPQSKAGAAAGTPNRRRVP